MRSAARVAGSLSLAVSVAAAQEVGKASLGPLELSVAEPFSRIVGLSELPDGRIVVVDALERVVRILTETGRASTISRDGPGPREYLSPFGVVRGRSDTLYVYDGRNRKFLRIAPNGSQVDDVPIPGSFLSLGGLAPPTGIDARGRIYWAGDVLEPRRGPGGIKRSATQNVRRWTIGTERLDTVARIADHADAMHAHRFHPFAERDAFVVSPDGMVGVLRASDYRLRWFRDGSLVREGPSIAFQPVPVTAAERAAFRAERASAPAGVAGVRGTGGSAGAGGSAQRLEMERAYPDEIFPSHKPPFVENGATRAPNGDIWVMLSMPHDATRSVVDVLTPEGAHPWRIDLPAGRRLLAVDRSGVYVVRIDDDGLQWLERYGVPAR